MTDLCDELLDNPPNRAAVIQRLAQRVPKQVTRIVAADGDSAIYGALVAQHLDLPFQTFRSIFFRSDENVDTTCERWAIVDPILSLDRLLVNCAIPVEILQSKAAVVLAVVGDAESKKRFESAVHCPIWIDTFEGQRSDGAKTSVKLLDAPVLCTNPGKDRRAIVMCHPNANDIAWGLCNRMPHKMRFEAISWGHFPNGWPNINFGDQERFANRDVFFVMDLHRISDVTEQLCLNVALCRQFARSVTFIVPYFGAGTMERVISEGELATAEPLLKLLSKPLPPTSGGLPALALIDIHDIRERFYPADNITPKMLTAAPLVLELVDKHNMTIVFPDEGAYKRFKVYCGTRPIVTFSKQRNGAERTMSIGSIEGDVSWERLIIWDDLVLSGGTLLECAKALHLHAGKLGVKAKVSAFVTHAVFEDGAHVKFLEDLCPISEFHVLNTVPVITKILQEYPHRFRVHDVGDVLLPFVSQRIAPVPCQSNKHQCHHLLPKVYISSTSPLKQRAVRRAFGTSLVQCVPVDCPSCIPEQPMGREEITLGLVNRHNALRKSVFAQFDTFNGDLYLVSIENGLVAAQDENGLTENGLTENGLTENGLTENGLTENGLEDAYVDEAHVVLEKYSPDASRRTLKSIVKCAAVKRELMDAFLTGRHPDDTLGTYLKRTDPDRISDDKDWAMALGQCSSRQDTLTRTLMHLLNTLS